MLIKKKNYIKYGKKKKENGWNLETNDHSISIDSYSKKKKKLISIDSSFWLNTNIFLT